MNKCKAWITGVLCAWMTVPLNGQGEKGIDTLKLLSRVKLGVYSLELSSGAKLQISNVNGFVFQFDYESARAIKEKGQHYGSEEWVIKGDLAQKLGGAARCDFVSVEQDSVIRFIAKGAILEVYRRPFRLVVKDLLGGILLADDSMAWIDEGFQLTHNVKLSDGERFLGLGEKTGPLDRRGNAYTHWNTDCFSYTVDHDPMYVSVPYYVGLHHNLMYGVYVDESSKSIFNFGAANSRFASVSVMSDRVRYFIVTGLSLSEITQRYTEIVGRTPMPPKWSLGFHQSRWGYQSAGEVLSLAETFKRYGLPIDAIHLDIPYMQDNKVFSFDSLRFQSPKLLVDALKKQGIQTVVILDPGIKIEKGYPMYELAMKRDGFVKYPDGKLYDAGVWPGRCHFPDFTHAQTRLLWDEQMNFYTQMGIQGFWNDMNEPAAWGKEMPTMLCFNGDGNPCNLIQARNVYGLNMSGSTYQAASFQLQERPFVLTRAGFAGTQRYSAVWTGDNVASDEHMLLSARLLNSMGMSGIGFCGADVGGFAKPTSTELYTRWMSLGAFTPFYRAHKMIDMPRSEPWSFGEDARIMVQYFLKLRYRLMPYLYSQFHHMHQTGVPVNRNLAFESPFDASIFSDAFQNQFFFGPSLLVAPVSSADKITRVLFPCPKENWYQLYTDEVFNGGNQYNVLAPLHALPVFAKGGSVVSAYDNVGNNTQETGDTLVLHIYRGTQTETISILFEDDGKSLKNASSCEVNMTLHSAEQQLSIAVKTMGELPFIRGYRYVKFQWHGYNNIMSAQWNGGDKRVPLRLTKTGFAFDKPLYHIELMALHPKAQCFALVIPVDEVFSPKTKGVLKWYCESSKSSDSGGNAWR